MPSTPEQPEKMLGGITGKGFMPGVSGNPSGRPKRKPFLEVIERWIEEHPEDITAVIKKAFMEAKGGSLIHLRELMDRIDGPVSQKVEASVIVELSSTVEQARKRAES